jgi:imidazolonepropionase-like amidohydrolase
MFRFRCKTGMAALILIGACLVSAAWAQDALVIRSAKIVTETGITLEGGTILVRNGLIEAIGKDLSIPPGAKVIDIPDGWVFPGLIDALTDLGAADMPLHEKDSDEATNPMTPQLRIIDAIDPGNPFIARARMTGMTAALVAPALGNLLSGQSALIRLAGDDVMKMTVKFPVAVNGSLGEPPKMRYGPKGQAPQTRMGSAALLRQMFWDVRNYISLGETYEKKLAEFQKKAAGGKEDPGVPPQPPATNSQLDALIPVVKGELPLILNANRMDDILTALRIANEFSLKLILSGGAEAYRVKEELADLKIPVLLRLAAVARLTGETGKATYENAAALFKAGVTVAFQTGSTAAFGELIPQAQAAIAHGLPWEEAFKAVTIYPARIFGVADRMGSLEKGKVADIAIFDGNPFVTAAAAKIVIIGGKIVVGRMAP